MRISLLADSTVYPLAGEAGVSERAHSSAGDFRQQPTANTQLVQKVRAANAEPLDRGNLLEVITFSTARQFASAAEAWLWSLDYDRTMPRAGTLVLEAIAAGGGVSTRHLLNALVAPPQRTVTGATVRLDYTVQGSNIIVVLVATGNMIVASADFPALDGVWENIGSAGSDRDQYTTAAVDAMQWVVGFPKWQIFRDGLVTLESTEDVATPDLVTTWTEVWPGSGTAAITITPETA